MTGFYRVGAPIVCIGIAICQLALLPGHGFLFAAFAMAAAAISWWSGRGLSDVWLDGDVLHIKGPTASLQVPLSGVVILRAQYYTRNRLIVLGLNPPVGAVNKVRFVPKGFWPGTAEALGTDLRARIYAARTA